MGLLTRFDFRGKEATTGRKEEVSGGKEAREGGEKKGVKEDKQTRGKRANNGMYDI